MEALGDKPRGWWFGFKAFSVCFCMLSVSPGSFLSACLLDLLRVYFLYCLVFSREFADVQEVSIIRDLQEAVTGRLLQGQASFKGVAPLYIAVLDASAALDGLLALQRLCGSSASGTKHAPESDAQAAASSSSATVAKRLLRLHASDKLAVVAHIPTWLKLLPSATRASQPFDELLALVHSVCLAPNNLPVLASSGKCVAFSLEGLRPVLKVLRALVSVCDPYRFCKGLIRVPLMRMSRQRRVV